MLKGIVLYEQADALKKLGFDEPSIAYFTENEKLCRYYDITVNPIEILLCTHKDIYYSYCLAPLYQDVFKWFRKRGFGIEIYSTSSENKEWYYLIKKGTITTGDAPYDSQEKAELECLKKLIEILSDLNKAI